MSYFFIIFIYVIFFALFCFVFLFSLHLFIHHYFHSSIFYHSLSNSLIDEGGDWDRRNRLKVYRGLYNMSIRDFSSAATLFLDTIATFTSYELMDYQQFVTYTVLCSMIALERPKLREKVKLPSLNYNSRFFWLYSF